ncbi:MAG: hypothetical protein H6564_22245 [Lewinellaceae bacterium]|nr:hypothetical protein [Lewinellaceae bacterium]
MAGISINPSRTIDNRTGNQWLGSRLAATAWFPQCGSTDEKATAADPILGFPGNPASSWKIRISRASLQVLTNTHLELSPLTNLRFRTELGVESYQVQQSVCLELRHGSGRQRTSILSNRQVFNSQLYQPTTWEQHERKITCCHCRIQLTKDKYQGQRVIYRFFR